MHSKFDYNYNNSLVLKQSKYKEIKMKKKTKLMMLYSLNFLFNSTFFSINCKEKNSCVYIYICKHTHTHHTPHTSHIHSLEQSYVDFCAE